MGGHGPAVGKEGGWGSSRWVSGSKYLCGAGGCLAQCWAWRDKGPRRRRGLASEAEFQPAPRPQARSRQWKPPTLGLVPGGRRSSTSLDVCGRVAVPLEPQSPSAKGGCPSSRFTRSVP